MGGLPFFEATGVSGTPRLQAIYSEAQQYLLPGGDAAAPGVPQDPAVAQPEVSLAGDAVFSGPVTLTRSYRSLPCVAPIA